MQIHSSASNSQSVYSLESAVAPSKPDVNTKTELATNPHFSSVAEPDKPEHARRENAPHATTTEKPKNQQQDSAEAKFKERQQKQELVAEQRQIAELSARDREVRAHEQAHMAVGGRYAGAASYQYQRGPDGVSYAVGGEVPISTSRESTPQETIQKAQIIRRAALAPAEPSSQDRRVAAQASAMEADARKELARTSSEEQAQKAEATSESRHTEGDDSIPASDRPSREPTASAEKATPEADGFITSFGKPAPSSVAGRLLQSVANTAFVSSSQGSVLDQLA